MANYKAILQYDGTPFAGFQVQSDLGLLTIQGEIQRILSQIFDAPIKIIAAGRTDTGVHAIEQVINFHAEKIIPPSILMRAINSLIHEAISISSVEIVDENFNARHCAKSRKYIYVVDNSPYPFALWRNRSYWFPHQLDIEKMKSAIKRFEGEHDFRRFAKGLGEIKNTRREIIRAEIYTSLSFFNFDSNSESVTEAPCANFQETFNTVLTPILQTSCLPSEISSYSQGHLLYRHHGMNMQTNAAQIFRCESKLIYFYFHGKSFLHSMVRIMVGCLLNIGMGKMEEEDVVKLLNPETNIPFHPQNIPGKGLYLVGVDY